MERAYSGGWRLFDSESDMNNCRKKLRSILSVIALVLIAGCVMSQHAPVINKSPSRVIPDAYQVKQGDSIYKIAWAFGVDFLDIAKWNKLTTPYTVKPGQIVYLTRPTVKTTPLVVTSQASNTPLIAKELPAKQPSPQPKQSTTASPAVKFSSNPGKWNWPAEGKLIGKYSPSTGSNGIQIAGTDGSPVKATAAGEVVYVGEGLRGYGRLIILKHSPEFLSAYAHNQEIRVNEGEVIQSGQQIATMGNSGTQSTMLHFEIRKDGKPVDPMKYLN